MVMVMVMVQCTIAQFFDEFAPAEKFFSSTYQNRTQCTRDAVLCESTHILRVGAMLITIGYELTSAAMSTRPSSRRKPGPMFQFLRISDGALHASLGPGFRRDDGQKRSVRRSWRNDQTKRRMVTSNRLQPKPSSHAREDADDIIVAYARHARTTPQSRPQTTRTSTPAPGSTRSLANARARARPQDRPRRCCWRRHCRPRRSP